MTPDGVRMHLDLRSFDAARFAPYVLRAQLNGLRLTTLADLGDTPTTRRRLYELNRTTAADIPERGPFYSYEEFVTERFGAAGYDPHGVVLALRGSDLDAPWVALSTVSIHRTPDPADAYAFAEMTGVLREHRGQGVSMAVKVVATEFARSTGVRWLRTIHHPDNTVALAMNRTFGFLDGLPPRVGASA